MIKSWDDVTLSTYIELLDIIEGEYTELDIISLLLDISVEELENMPYDDMTSAIDNIDFINKPISTKNLVNVEIGGKLFYPIPFNDIEFGAFIDIEHYISSNKDYKYNINKILNIIYRRMIKAGDALNKAILEPYDNWSDTRYQMYDKVPITSVYGVLEAYMVWRKDIFEKFQGLFNDGEAMDEEEEKKMLSEMTAQERKQYLNERNVGKWGWSLYLFKLAKRNPLKMLEAAKMNIIMALNILSMHQELKIDESR